MDDGYSYVPLELMSHADMWIVMDPGPKRRTDFGVVQDPAYFYVAVVKPSRAWGVDKDKQVARTHFKLAPVGRLTEYESALKLRNVLLVMDRNDFSFDLQRRAGRQLTWLRRVCNLGDLSNLQGEKD